MLAKITTWFSSLNEQHFNLGYIILTAVIMIINAQFGFISFEIIAGIMIKSSIFVATTVIFLKTLMGVKFDVLKEIKDDQNIALAIVLAGFMAGLGFSIGGL
ncbi:MAG: hypothetical protein PHY48_15125 [Candidatus Cloacimonetes bacterium]|nr:hypothetical protein [Candidatus Cloacimonadota bacterium]